MTKASLLVFSLLIACNSSDLVSNPPVVHPSPTPTSSPMPTPPPCDPNVIGPSPNITSSFPTVATGVNADYYFIVPDPWDNDDNTFEFVWGCTKDPRDPNPPHKVVETVDISADDGDPNVVINGPHFYDCCLVIP